MNEKTEPQTSASARVPRCPECGQLMHPVPYGWWACLQHPWRMAPDRNHPDREQLTGTASR